MSEALYDEEQRLQKEIQDRIWFIIVLRHGCWSKVGTTILLVPIRFAGYGKWTCCYRPPTVRASFNTYSQRPSFPDPSLSSTLTPKSQPHLEGNILNTDPYKWNSKGKPHLDSVKDMGLLELLQFGGSYWRFVGKLVFQVEAEGTPAESDPPSPEAAPPINLPPVFHKFSFQFWFHPLGALLQNRCLHLLSLSSRRGR